MRLAFPYHKNLPAEFLQGGDVADIPLRGAVPLLRPKFRASFGNHNPPPAVVAMPETAMNEDRHPVFRQNHIGPAGQVFSVQAKFEAQRMKMRAHA